MTEFSPDTCNCIVDIQRKGDTFEFLEWINKCEIHKNFDAQQLLDEILIHNNAINTKFGNKPNQIQMDQIKLDRRTEMLRIRKIGPGDRNPSPKRSKKFKRV